MNKRVGRRFHYIGLFLATRFMLWKFPGREDFFLENNKRVYPFIRDLRVPVSIVLGMVCSRIQEILTWRWSESTLKTRYIEEQKRNISKTTTNIERMVERDKWDKIPPPFDKIELRRLVWISFWPEKWRIDIEYWLIFFFFL